jgi:hypothetical protein
VLLFTDSQMQQTSLLIVVVVWGYLRPALHYGNPFPTSFDEISCHGAQDGTAPQTNANCLLCDPRLARTRVLKIRLLSAPSGLNAVAMLMEYALNTLAFRPSHVYFVALWPAT